MGEYQRRNSDITPDFFQELASVSDPGVRVTSIEVSAGSGRGDNYTSMLYRVKAKGITETNSSWSKSFVYKCLPHSRVRREAFKSDALFLNEVAFYTKALPALMAFQSSKGCNDFNEIPKVYLARSNVLVLEDLKERDFVMADRKIGLDVEHCKAVMRSLAKFHALSMAMKALEPETFFSEVANVVSECLFQPENEEWYRNYYRSATSNAVSFVRECLITPEERKRYVEKFEGFVDDFFFRRMVSLVEGNEPVAVLCHGDCWTNNILFRYDDHGNILGLCFLDFQLTRYGSPALDLVNFLYCCTSRMLRTNHMENLLSCYCETLRESLTKLGAPNGPFGNEDLTTIIKAEVHKCAKFGLGLAIDMIPISTCDSDQAPDLYGSVAEENISGEQPVWTKNERREVPWHKVPTVPRPSQVPPCFTVFGSSRHVPTPRHYVVLDTPDRPRRAEEQYSYSYSQETNQSRYDSSSPYSVPSRSYSSSSERVSRSTGSGPGNYSYTSERTSRSSDLPGGYHSSYSSVTSGRLPHGTTYRHYSYRV